MFNIDFRKIAYNLLPYFLRGVKTLAFVDSLIKPIKTLNGLFNSLRNNINYKLLFTAQIIYLEHYLNDQFDQVLRGIYIENIEETDFTFLYNVIELKPAFYVWNLSEAQPDVYFYNWYEIVTGDSYIVHVPIAVAFTETNMRSKIDFYNNAGKNYSITTY